MIKKYNLAKPEKYIGKDNQEKTMWHNCGTLTEFHKQDGTISRIVEIPAIGLKANVFEMKPKQTQQTPPAQPNTPDNEESINPDEIPF